MECSKKHYQNFNGVEKMIYEKTQEEFDATMKNLVFTLGQLRGVVPSEETINACKEDALYNWGKIRIVTKEV